MMPLDSWIDEEALAMMRALAPKPSSPPDAPTRPSSELLGQESALFSPEMEERPPVASAPAPPRIAKPDEAAPEAVERMRQRLAEIRRRAENRGIVRTHPTAAAPTPPIAPVEGPPPPSPESTTETAPLPSPEPIATPSAPVFSEPAPNGPTGPTALTSPAVPETTWIEPANAGPPQDQTPPVAPQTNLPAATEPKPTLPVALPKPLLPPLEPEETWESESLPPLESLPTASDPEAPSPAPNSSSPPPALPTAPVPVPVGPLSVRIAAFRRWLESDCGFTASVVIDQRGNTLHPADGLETMVAAATSLGSAWAEACAVANPGAQPRAAHSAWGGQTLVIVPVPTRFGDLLVAGTVRSALSPELATAIAAALRQAAGV